MRYRRVKNVAWRRVGEETVIVHLARRRMLAVNAAGGEVWDALARGGAVAAGELAAFLADLEAEGVVERAAENVGERLAGERVVEGVAAEGERVADRPAHEAAAVTVPAAAAVLWREELHHFGGCGFMPDQSPICDQSPFQS